jgi:nicotinamidase-related amidase
MLPAMTLDPNRTAVLALHWQVNVIEPHGFFGGLLAAPVAASGVVGRASAFHDAVRRLGVGVFFTRFTIPEGEGALVRNTAFMTAVGGAQESFRPESPGAALVDAMTVGVRDLVVDNQRLSGLAASPLPDQLTERGIDTLLVTGVATNLTVEQTARHGTDLGFTVHVISDCVTAADEATHQASLANLELATAGSMTAEEALAQLSE